MIPKSMIKVNDNILAYIYVLIWFVKLKAENFVFSAFLCSIKDLTTLFSFH